MKSILISLLILIPTNTFAVSYAWWVTISFTPTDTQIYGQSVHDIDPTLKKVTTIDWAIIQKETIETYNYNEKNSNGCFFKIKGDFNTDAIEDIAEVGVYEDDQGKLGRLLIIRSSDRKLPYIFKIPGKPGFSILKADFKLLVWFFCMECDNYVEIKWDGMNYKMIIPEPIG